MKCRGKIKLPGDKSISHRSLMLGCLSGGKSTVSNLSTGRDLISTMGCLRACGIPILDLGSHFQVYGGEFKDPDETLDCGNSGTTARLLVGLLAGQGINFSMHGDESLSRRPMGRVTSPLSLMGANFEGQLDYLPLNVKAATLSGINHHLQVPSAQVKSSILLAGLGAQGDTIITDSHGTRDHTEIMLRNMGANIEVEGDNIHLKPLEVPLDPFEIEVPSDPSSVAFFAAAATLLPGSELILENVLLNPTRIGFLKILQKMGGCVEIENQREEFGEMVGDVKVKWARLKGINLGSEDIPSMVDEIPILAILASQAEGVTKVTGASELRVKECDRIAAIVDNLSRMGAEIEEFEDGFELQGGASLRATKIETYHDHRIAMAFAVANLVSEGDVMLDDPDCVGISLPGFFDQLNSILED